MLQKMGGCQLLAHAGSLTKSGGAFGKSFVRCRPKSMCVLALVIRISAFSPFAAPVSMSRSITDLIAQLFASNEQKPASSLGATGKPAEQPTAPLPPQSDTPQKPTVANELESPAMPPIEQVHALVGQVTEVTTTVANDVGRHNVNVQALSNELGSVAQNDPAAVAAIVCKLLVANQELQGRLERAERTLQTHSRKLEEAIVSSRTDGLTGLTNRRALDEELRRCLVELQGQGRPAALLMLDVDHFKNFNDTHGHVAGDQALVHVAEMLRSQARASDIVARFGGEEFAVVFTAATATAIRERAERLRRAIGSRDVICDGREVRITASAGLAEAHSDDAAADWIRRADAALYAAKKAGRDRAYFAGENDMQLITIAESEKPGDSEEISATSRAPQESGAELAPEAFADTNFFQNVAKRIAEWKRGGTTLTVLLAELDGDGEPSVNGTADSPRPIRLAVQYARGSIREMDVITRWRQGGLAILLPCTSAADAKAVARRLQNALAQYSAIHTSDPAVSLSIGIAEGIEGNDARRVLERAWLALEAARSEGPAGMCVHDGVKTVIVKRPLPVKQ